MKIRILILFFSILFLSCLSTQNPQNQNSRFKNSEFVSILDSMLLEIRPNVNHYGKYSATFLTTENHIYISLLDIDCANLPYYHFQEKINKTSLTIYISENSVDPERFFNLTGLDKSDSYDDGIYCDDFFSVIARLDITNNAIKFIKMRKMNDDYDADFVAKEDSMYVHTRVRVVEPENKVKLEKDENN